MLTIVGAERGEGRTYLAANLAIVFSQLGERTLLVDADLREPRQHFLFHLENQVGFSTLLAGRSREEAIVRIPDLAGLSVLPAGPTPPNPARAAEPAQLRRVHDPGQGRLRRRHRRHAGDERAAKTPR